MKASVKAVSLFAITLIVFAGCNSESKESDKKANTIMLDAPSAVSIPELNPRRPTTSSSAAVEKGKDSSKFFIRTADLKFKAKDVTNTTYLIEDAVDRMGGYVSYTGLNSTADSKITTAVSADSSIETTYYTVTNTMVIRVPNVKLDSTLKAIAPLVDYMDYRIIKANDVALQLRADQLMQQRLSKQGTRLSGDIDNKGKRLGEVTDAEKYLTDKQEQSDNAKLNSIALLDEVRYSTINLSIYQAQNIKRDVLPNYKNTAAYEPGFGIQLMEALKFGWSIMEALLVFMARIWSLILMGVAAFFLFRIAKNKFKVDEKLG
jgi:hypothetical protein